MRSILYPLFIACVCILMSISYSASAQYCVSNLYYFGCIYGDEIDNITVGTISQTGTGCGNNGYSDYTNLTSNFEQGSSYTLQVSTANYGETVSMWVDFNDDYDFSTSEKLVSYLYCGSAFTNYTASFIIPFSAQPGNHRMRVRCVQYPYPFPFDACGEQNYGEVHDYTANITPPIAMSYISSTATQTATDNVSLGSSDVELIGVQVVTSGSLNPISATSFTLNSNGSTNFAADVTGVKIYYTGTDPDFSATNLFGSATNLSVPITGNQQLTPGVNYFWVAYDISSAGVIGDLIDAECTSVSVGGSAYTPTVTAPAGNRALGYCTPTSLYGCYFAYIDGVQLNSLSNLFTYCNGNLNGYIEYSPVGNLTTDLEIGTSYPITISGSPYEYEGFGVWIDFNNDGDFSDADEFLWSSSATGFGAQTGTVSIPNNASYIGSHRMRVRCADYALVNSGQSCSEFSYGEAEDYTININTSTPMVYVSSTATQDNFSFVQKGTNDVEIIGVQVVTSGALNPFNLTSFTINSNGSTNFSNDVSNVKVYYTGSSSTFAATTLFGSASNLSSPITGNLTLMAGTNYFWVTYDVTAAATIGDQLDAECTQVTMTGAGGTQIPTTTAPPGSRQIDYCLPVNQYGCYYGYIDGVVINTLDNQGSNCNGNAGSYIQYSVTDFTTSLEQGTTYPIFLTGGPSYESVGFGVWIDFNNDGDFNDAGEFAWSSPFATSGIQTGSISVPATATLGDHRMRIRSKDYYILFSNESCGETYYDGESEDYTITITSQTSMTYVSSTTVQNNLDPVTAGEADQDIASIQIVTSGSLNPFSATSFKLNSNGSSDFSGDVTNVKIYYTGNSPVFSATTLFGSSTNLSSPITGNQVLSGGTNYFWVVYDVAGSATLGDFLDAECEYIVMSGAVGQKVPTVTAPAGNRMINYCTGTNTYGCSYSYINGVTLNTLVNTFTYCNGNADGYIEYPQSGNTTTQLELGQTYDIQLDGPPYDYVGFGVWIDMNGNGSFNDPGEFVFSSPYTSYGSQFGTISLPCDNAFIGDHRMRVRVNYYSLVADSDACSTFSNGETEDYTITLAPPTTNQTYTSSVCYQNNLDNIPAGTTNADIMSIQIDANGCLNPLNVTSFSLNSTGTTDFANDVTNVSIYYTGTDPNFSATNLFGSATDLSLPITGSQSLNSGTNYFWVAYDISSNATLGDYADAGCNSIDITGQGTVTPINANPYGSRQINLCVPTLPNYCFSGDYINNVELNTLSNLYSGCNGNVNNYIYYAPAGNLTTNVMAGNSYNISLASGYVPLGFGVWIDFNNNNDFGDAGEFVYASPSYGYSYNGTITLPIDPSFYGLRRMRVRGVDYTVLNAQDYCNNSYYSGETEDYMITIDAPPSCTGTPVAGVVTADPVIVCGGGNTATLDLSGYSPAADLTFQWQKSPDGNTWNNIAGATSTAYSEVLSSSTYYRAVVTCTNSGLSSNSSNAYVQVGGNEQITSTTGATICGEDTAHISATGNGSLIIWYPTQTSPIPLYYSSSPSTFSPFINSTTTYYASAADGQIDSAHVGPIDDNIGITNQYYQYAFQYFDVLKACTVKGVYVYPASTGNVILQLTDNNYNIIMTDTLVVTSAQVNQKTYMPLNWYINPGTDYHLAWAYGSVNLYSNDYNYAGYGYPYTIPEVISITRSSYGTQYYFYAYDWIVNYSTLCESARTPVTVTVTPSAEVTITPNPSNATLCAGSGQTVTLSASGGGYNSFIWSPAAGLSSSTGAAVIAQPVASTNYILTATDGNCTNLDTIYVNVAEPPSVTATASPGAVCTGGSSQLYASTPALEYSVVPIPFAPDQSNAGTTVSLTDESVSGAIPLGFNFNFYGNNYSQFYLSSNGWLSFDAPISPACCQGQFLPDPNTPNNLIAFCWEDLNPGIGGTINYYTIGTAPFRKCVINYTDIQHYYSGDPVTVQTILYETSNMIDVITTTMPGNPSGSWYPHTVGIENGDGTKALAVPGRNADATWTANNDAWRFAPQQYTYAWTPTATLDNALIVNPAATPNATTTYTVSVTDNITTCSSTATVTVSMVTTPVAGTITPDLTEFCGNGTALLNIDGYSPGATIQWQQSVNSGGPYSNIPGATDPNYTTASLNTTMYYVASVSCANSSVTSEATVQIDAAPNPPVGIDGVNCGPGNVILQATGSGNGTLNWYYSPNGTNYLGSGSPFTSPYVSQTTTFYVSEGAAPAPPLSTTYFGSSLSNGNMFDVTAINDLFITGFDVNMSLGYTSDFEIYYKTGSFLGSEYQPQNWTLLGIAPSVQGLGAGAVTPLPVPLYLHVGAGETVAFYITATNTAAYVNSTYGSFIGNVYAQDNNIQIKEGDYFYYPFSYGYGPYVWNGTVHYVAPGCESTLTPVLAQITAPQVLATASASSVCEGDPITLTAVNLGQQSFTYEWMPQIPGMQPQNGLDDTVTVTPPVTMTFTVSITDPNAPLCDTIIMVPVTVDPTPGAFISNLDPQYYVNAPAVTMNGIPAGGTFGGPGVNGNVFDPSSLPVGGPYIITYTYTDQNGCTGTYEQAVYIVPLEGISDVLIDRNLQLFPNPSEGLFNMSLKLPSQAEHVIVTVYDQIGKQVFVHDYGKVKSELMSEFDFSESAKESYYITINVDGMIFYRKIEIQ